GARAEAAGREPPRSGGDPRHQLQGAALQNQGSGARQSIVSELLTRETFEFVLSNELKRAVRSQNFVTLVLMEPSGGEPGAAVREIAGIVSRELRGAHLLATD